MKDQFENNNAVRVDSNGCNEAVQKPEEHTASQQNERDFWRDAKYAQDKDISER